MRAPVGTLARYSDQIRFLAPRSSILGRRVKLKTAREVVTVARQVTLSDNLPCTDGAARLVSRGPYRQSENREILSPLRKTVQLLREAFRSPIPSFRCTQRTLPPRFQTSCRDRQICFS